MSDCLRILSAGGLGDALLGTPAIRELRRRHPGRKIVIHAPRGHGDVYRGNPHLSRVSAYLPFMAPFYRWAGAMSTLYSVHLPSLVYRKTHATELIGENLGVVVRDRGLVLSITPREDEAALARLGAVGRPVVVIHTVSRCSRNHIWPGDRWGEVVSAIPECSFLQVGHADEPLVRGAVDLRGRTSFRQACALIKHACCFAGVDSAMGHAASAVGTPGVVLFGDSSPSIWGHASNLNIYKGFRCSPCVDLLRGGECPYENRCMRAIEVGEVVGAIRRQARTGAAG